MRKKIFCVNIYFFFLKQKFQRIGKADQKDISSHLCPSATRRRAGGGGWGYITKNARLEKFLVQAHFCGRGGRPSVTGEWVDRALRNARWVDCACKVVF